MARDANFEPLKLASPTLVRAFYAAKIKGAGFYEAEEWFDYIPPEEYLERVFPEKPEAAKRYFVTLLNDDAAYALLKKDIAKYPKELLTTLVTMTFSRSSYHKRQCEELLSLLNRLSHTDGSLD